MSAAFDAFLHKVAAVVAYRFEVVGLEPGGVVAQCVGKNCIPFYGYNLRGTGGHMQGVDAESGGKVGNGADLRHQRAMVCGQGVGGALFAGKHARKHESGKCGKCVGQFCGELPARIDLQQCGSHVETAVAACIFQP